MKTQVAIIGSGPAGLMLGHSLAQAGIDCLILERSLQEHVEARIRAGVLEEVTTTMMANLGLDARLRQEGMRHDGVTLINDGQPIHVEIAQTTGKNVTVYGQTEITKDLIAAAPNAACRLYGKQAMSRCTM
jgi:p-hydroxybenzoate 3-monooxygenase